MIRRRWNRRGITSTDAEQLPAITTGDHVVELDDTEAELLAVIAISDPDAFAHWIRAHPRWWRTLRRLERERLVAVAVVGPDRQRWPWVRAVLTPTGRNHHLRSTQR